MLIQFKMMIISLFMTVNIGNITPVIDMDNVDDLREMSCLSQAVHGEAGNQSMRGKIAVAFVIVNRTKDNNFPSDICGVIKQKGQFDFLRHVKLLKSDSPEVRKQMEEVIKASWLVMNGEVTDPTKGALYFINTHSGNNKVWSRDFKRLIQIEKHIFYTRKA